MFGYQPGMGALNLRLGWDVWHGAPNWRAKLVRSQEQKIINILRAYELKFGPNLGCRTENS